MDSNLRSCSSCRLHADLLLIHPQVRQQFGRRRTLLGHVLSSRGAFFKFAKAGNKGTGGAMGAQNFERAN